LLGNSGTFDGVLGDSVNVRTEDRYYLGFDSRYRIGNWRLELSFIYLLGTQRFLGGSEIDFYTILAGLTWTPRFSWAFLADAWESNNRKAQDAWVLINRMIYIF